MLTIKYNDSWVYVPGDDSLTALSPSLSLESNKAGSLEFTLPQGHSMMGSIPKLINKMHVYDGSTLLWKGRCVDTEDLFYGDRSFTCEGKLAALNDSLYRPYEFTGTPEELFTAILANHNSQVSADQKILKGTCTVTDPNNYIARSWDSALSSWEVLQTRLVDSLGGYLRMRYESDGDYLDYLASFSTASTQHIELGENLLDLTSLVDATTTYTACIPYGAEIKTPNYSAIDKTTAEWAVNTYYTLVSETYVLIETESAFNTYKADTTTTIYKITSYESTGKRVDITSVNNDLDYLINTTAQATYGTIYAPVKETTWDDVTEPANLKTKATNWLANQGVMLANTTELSFADLSRLGVSVQDISLYDLVRVTSDFHNIDTTYLVKSVSYDMSDPSTSAIKVGDDSLSLTDKTTQNAKDIANMYVVVDKVDTLEVNIKSKETTASVDAKIRTVNTALDQRAEAIEANVTANTQSISSLSQQTASLKVTADGIEGRVSDAETKLTAYGETYENVNAYFDFTAADGLTIGREGEYSTMVLDNDSLEFKINNQTVATFTNDHMEVRNYVAQNQVNWFDDWAIRKGAYISGKGYNLNDMWIGG